MRTYFANISRPKRTAAAIQDLFPLVSHAQALEYSARLYGYRTWNELTLITKRADHPPSPDEDEIPEPERDNFIQERWGALNSVLGLHPIGDFLMCDFLKIHRKEAPMKRRWIKEHCPDGVGRLYRVLQAELELPRRKVDQNSLLAPECLNGPERHGHFEVPQIVRGGEQGFLDALCKKIERYKGGADTSDRLRWYFQSNEHAPGPTDFTLVDVGVGDESEQFLISQSCTKRLYVFDQDYDPKGVIIWTLTIRACQNDDEHNTLTLLIHDAWAAPRDHETWDSFCEVLSSELHYRFDLALNGFFFPPTEVGPKIEISLESESETLLGNSHGLLQSVRSRFADLAELPENCADVSYYE